jgi:RNA polymerase sigma-54 factor
MKQALTLKLGQHLAMTPQLQQAIRLLQLSTLDLRAEVQQVVDSNPMLELLDDEDDWGGESAAEAAETVDVADTASDERESTELGDGNDWEQQIPEDLPVDTNWEDVYPSSAPTNAPSEEFESDARNAAEETLTDHLHWQLNLTPMSDRDRLVATAIIDAIDADGMLTVPDADILSGLPAELDIDADEYAAVLKRIQQFDPPGVGARDLRECLSIQLSQLPDDAAFVREARTLVVEHLDLLAAQDVAGLKRRLRLEDDALREVIRLIQSLNPRPGASFGASAAEYVVPDVVVRKQGNRWLVELNPEAAPRVRINREYAGLVRRADSSADNTYLKNNLQEARWFLKSLQSRNETLLKVARRIVEHQRGFLEYGEEAMKPLVLNEIAEAVEMHESTISRVTTRKYMHTPRGIFELKYFFSSHVGSATGGEVSSTAIRALIRKLCAEENPRKPLSDSAIAAILAEQKINVARRTVAKYRELLSIPPSNERKRLV